MTPFNITLATCSMLMFAGTASGEIYRIRAGDEWSKLGPKLTAGDEVILLEGAHLPAQFEGLAGAVDKPIVIRSEDKGKLAEIAAEREGLKLTNCSHVRIERLYIKNARRAGIVIDATGQGRSTDIAIHDTLVIGVRGLVEQAGLLAISTDGIDIQRSRFDDCEGAGCRFENSSGISAARLQIKALPKKPPDFGVAFLGDCSEIQCDDIWIAGNMEVGISLGAKDAPRAPRTPRPLPIPSPALPPRAGGEGTADPEAGARQSSEAPTRPAGENAPEGQAAAKPDADKSTPALCSKANFTNVFIRGTSRALEIGSSSAVQFASSTIVENTDEVIGLVAAAAGRMPASLRFRDNLVVWRPGALRRLVGVPDGTPASGLVFGSNIWWSRELPSALHLLGPAENPLHGTLEVPQTYDLDPELDGRSRPTVEAAKMFGRIAS